MDYFYNSLEFNNRSKLSEKEKIELNEFIFSILELYKQYSQKNFDILGSKIINQIYLLKIGLKILSNIQSFENSNEKVSRFYIIDKIIKFNILSGNYRSLDFLKKIIIMEFFIGIEKTSSIRILKEKIISICGENYRKNYLIFENFKEEKSGSILYRN
jgi:hypothetical protein